MTADPLDQLSEPVVPLRPDPGFAVGLRRTLAEQLGLTDKENAMTEPSAADRSRPTITPYLSVSDPEAAIEWYQRVFAAVLEGEPVRMPDGSIGHSELRIGGSLIMMAGEYEAEAVRSPESLGGTCVQLRIEVDDADDVFDRAVAAGATVWRPVAEAYGDRAGKVRDPFGHNWFIAGPLEPSS